MVIATSCNQIDDFELLFTLFAWYSSVFHQRRDGRHACGHAQSSVPPFNGLEITQYLQNLGRIEESLNKENAQHNKQGNSKPKAHKAHKHQKKHGKNQCRKHPNHDHTWADCFDNPKGKNYRGNKNANHNNNNNNNGNKNQIKKVEARVLDVDSDADMDCTLTIINLNEEVSNKTVELQDSKPSADNTAAPLPPSTVNKIRITEKQRVTFATSNTNNTFESMSNKKQRLLYKHHFCYMQIPISRKLHKVDNTSMLDLTTDVTALVKNLTGLLPIKLTQVLIDTSCSKTLIKKQ
jgi:hypothetical protein